jgi:TRAP transporter TAXI family solute receptor
MKRIIGFYAVCVVMVCLFVLSSWTVFAQDKWAMGTSSAGSGPYAWGGSITKVLNKHLSSVRLSPQVTAGFNENVELTSTGKIEIAQQAAAGLLDAYMGKGAFRGKAHKRLRVLFTFVIAPCHVVAREASNIKTIYDIKMKKINIGLPAQTTRIDNEALLQAANIKMQDIKMFQLGTGEAFSALKDGVIDASINYYSVGHGRLLELAVNTNVKVISVPDEIIDRLEKIRPGFVKFTIPADTYKGQASPVKTFASPTVLFARDDLPENKVYEITKAFWSNLEELQKDPVFKGLTKDLAYSEKMEIPYHPGAVRYFKEMGLVK